MVREGVAAAAVVTDHGPGLVQAAPELAGQDGLYGVVGVESGGGQAVPDGVGGGPQQRSGDQPVASLSAVVRAFPGSGSLSASNSGTAARWTARKAVASMQAVTCRCQGVHLRTWYWARPTSCLLISLSSSICQRPPAREMISATVVRAGAWTR